MGKAPGMAISSLVIGILGLVLFWLPFIGLILGIVALVLGIVYLNRISKGSDKSGKGIAIAGLVLGSVSVILGLFIFVGAIAYFGVLNPAAFAP